MAKEGRKEGSGLTLKTTASIPVAFLAGLIESWTDPIVTFPSIFLPDLIITAELRPLSLLFSGVLFCALTLET